MEKRKNPAIEVCEEEVDCESGDIELEVEDAFVQAIDGVLIGGDEEEIKLLFYFIKPSVNALEDDIPQCKAVSEFRTSRTKFLEIAKYIHSKAKDYNRYQRKLEDYMFA